ncbi:MAG: hypothetical protein QXL51_03050 [Candidatus Aenigmatarchaeota archaeon]
MNKIKFGILLCFVVFLYGFSPTNFEQKEKIAIMPFENYSEDKNALNLVMPLIRKELEIKGFFLIDEENVNKFMVKERLRYSDGISSEIAKKMHKELNVDVIMVGCINSFSVTKPEIGLTAKLINASDGSILWANHASAQGEDFVGILGLGKIDNIEKLAEKIVKMLFNSISLNSFQKEIESTYKIMIIPFYNRTKIKNAGMIVTNLFIVEMLKNKDFIPLELGETKKLMINLKIRKKGEIDSEKLKALSEFAKIDGILVGSVDIYKEKTESLPPEVSICVRVLDIRKNKLVWSDCDSYQGDEGIIFFDWGKINTVENTAYKLIKKILKRMDKMVWEY